jgi:hypothetical protein
MWGPRMGRPCGVAMWRFYALIVQVEPGLAAAHSLSTTTRLGRLQELFAADCTDATVTDATRPGTQV